MYISIYIIIYIYIHTRACVQSMDDVYIYGFICRFIHLWYCTRTVPSKTVKLANGMCPPLAPRLETTNLRCCQLEKAKATSPNWCSSPLALNV